MALALTRAAGQNVLIYLPDGRIVDVYVHRIEGTWVKLGIQAPRDVIIVRGELAEAKGGGDDNGI